MGEGWGARESPSRTIPKARSWGYAWRWQHLQVQLHRVLQGHRETGEGRLDFPKESKKDDACGEREGEGEAGAEAARLAELPAVPCPARSPQGWCSAWEMLSLPPGVPNSHFPVGLKPPGFTGGESCCSGVIWCMKCLGDILKTFHGVKQQLRLCLAQGLGRDRHGSGGHVLGLPHCSSLGLLIINPNYNTNYKPHSKGSRVHARCSHHGEQWEQSRGHAPSTLLGAGGPELPLPRAERLLPHVPCSAEGILCWQKHQSQKSHMLLQKLYRKVRNLRLRNCSLILMMLNQIFTNGQNCNGNKWNSLGENIAVVATHFTNIFWVSQTLNQDGAISS